MRCLAFAETLRWAGWSCGFAMKREGAEFLPARAMDAVEMHALDDDAGFDVAGATLAVVDHYGLDAAFERQASAQGARVIVFDDLADRPHDCAVLVDPTPGRTRDDYRAWVPEDCRLMLGPKHALVGRRWLAHRAAMRERMASGSPVERIIVSMGGTDPQDATSRVLSALSVTGLDAHVDVVLGSGAQHRERVASALGPSATLHVDPPDPAALAAGADLAIGAPGSSSFERAALGLPAILIPLADNQRGIADAFAAASAAEIVPTAMLDDPPALAARVTALAADRSRRAAMSRNAARLTDGRGCRRLLAAVAGDIVAKSERSVRLRLAEAEDEGWLLELQRQEPTRRFARDPAIPSAAEHARWFARVLDDSERLLMIVETDDTPSGMVRLDRLSDQPTAFEVSIAVDVVRQGEGIGAAALALLRRLAPGADFVATVKAENRPSLALFAAAGYRPDGDDRYRLQAA